MLTQETLKVTTPSNAPAEVLQAIRPDGLALALYGSRARGTARPDSDIDVLQLVPRRPGSYSRGPVNVTAYLPHTLRLMAEQGSLFVLHLRVEAQVFSDPEGKLAEVLNAYREPRDYDALFGEIRAASMALHKVSDTGEYGGRLRQLGVYLLRTALYARLAEAGIPTFDLAEAAKLYPSARVATALALRYKEPVVANDLEVLRRALEVLLGSLPGNPWGSVEALAVGLSRSRPHVASLLGQVLFATSGGLEYTALTPSPL